MIESFADAGTEDVYNGVDSKAARKCCPHDLWRQARRKLDMLDAAVSLAGLRFPPGNRLEGLKGDRRGEFSIRINDQYRICFRWTEAGPREVAIVDYH
ncbi:MAG TPA: type II toxin-antitoxin system RelE/ParE family toxin [Gemmatimonadaceae bacterium]|nr:type II toxin-antitoxin system RelE/ParE family toxin [Gemmatimonadaceae bacterium]